MKIKAIITDFDGTLVDTFTANYFAYKEAFGDVGLSLTYDQYEDCYGLRFDAFMDQLNVNKDLRQLIKNRKKSAYPRYFSYIKLNKELYNFIVKSKASGIKTAIASTAAKDNLYNVLAYLNIKDTFDYIITGDDVLIGKPNPEVYNKAINKLNISPQEALIFEDSQVGISAAEASGANWIRV